MGSNREVNYYGDAPLDRRAAKRAERKGLQENAVYDAWLRGEDHGFEGKPYRNTYPLGKRRDEYARGYEMGKAARVAYPSGGY